MKIDHKSYTRCQIKDFIRDILRNGPAKVVFTKKDGTIREMVCTLKRAILEEKQIELVNSNSDRRANDEVLNVYDLEKDDWRAFRIDNVHTIEACVFDG